MPSMPKVDKQVKTNNFEPLIGGKFISWLSVFIALSTIIACYHDDERLNTSLEAFKKYSSDLWKNPPDQEPEPKSDYRNNHRFV